MIAIIDYGVGNLFSLKSSFAAIGYDAEVTGETEKIRNAEKLILPGVGAFADAAEKLTGGGLDGIIKEQAKSGKPIMGICLGMQLLFDKSFEYGEHDGLGLIEGEICPIADVIPKGLKIPHIGWNALNITQDSPIFKYTESGDFVYFVHSYYAKCTGSVTSTAEYGYPLTASVQKGNVYGCQFHPEKSGKTGLGILKAFCEI